jgi:predicted protein tyrosine phosphatase
MEPVHRKRLNSMFGSRLRAKKLVVLGIPDNYDYMDPELIKLLKTKLAPYLPKIETGPPRPEVRPGSKIKSPAL